MSHKRQIKIITLGVLPAALLCLGYLAPMAHSAEEPVIEINSWSALWSAAGNPSVTNMKLMYDVTSSNACSVPWKVSTASRVLDLNGHTITSTGGSSGDCVMYVSYDTGWNNYSFTIKNGKLAQNFTKASTSSLLYANKASSTASNYNLVLQNVDMEMSPTTKVGSAIRFEQATNTLHSRKLEINGGKYDIVGSGAINFQTYTSTSGNTEYSPNDQIVLKKMQIKKNLCGWGYKYIL